MREILFRGKREDRGEWVFGFLLKDRWGNYMIQDSQSFEWFTDIETESIGQYTGLSDKNGVKIFEGDIVRFESGAAQYDGNGVISWDEKLAMFVIKWASRWRNFDDVYEDDCEIIGNIHDNPELIP